MEERKWSLKQNHKIIIIGYAKDEQYNTPTLTISAMRSLVTKESQDTDPKDGTLHRAMSPITALGNTFFRPKEIEPPTGPPKQLPAASGLSSRD